MKNCAGCKMISGHLHEIIEPGISPETNVSRMAIVHNRALGITTRTPDCFSMTMQKLLKVVKT